MRRERLLGSLLALALVANAAVFAYGALLPPSAGPVFALRTPSADLTRTAPSASVHLEEGRKPPASGGAGLLEGPTELAALLQLAAKKPPLGFGPEQEKRLASALTLFVARREAGSATARAAAILTPEQLAFLQGRIAEPAEYAPRDEALQALRRKAGGEAAAVASAAVGPPVFDVDGLYRAIVLLEKQEPPLSLDPHQAAALLPEVERLGLVAAGGPDPERVLSPEQRAWVRANAPRVDLKPFQDASRASAVELTDFLRQRLQKELAR